MRCACTHARVPPAQVLDDGEVAVVRRKQEVDEDESNAFEKEFQAMMQESLGQVRV